MLTPGRAQDLAVGPSLRQMTGGTKLFCRLRQPLGPDIPETTLKAFAFTCRTISHTGFR
jgi:hypothetical protein